MKRYICNKLIYAALSLWVLITLTFVLLQCIPGDPFSREQALPPEVVLSLKKHYGLNDSLLTQYFRYIYQTVTFNFGPSMVYKGRTIYELIVHSFPVSALLGLETLLLALPLGICIGIVGAIYENRWQDKLFFIMTVLLISIPSFMMATLLQYGLAIKISIFPIARWGTFYQSILPCISLSLLPMAFIARLTKSKLSDELNQPYILTARAKGLPEPVIIFRHALRNILAPILSYVGPMAAGILTGSFIIERIFNIPGLGYWFVSGVSNRDYPMIMGITIFYGTLLLLISVVVELLIAYIDPRIRTEKYEEGVDG